MHFQKGALHLIHFFCCTNGVYPGDPAGYRHRHARHDDSLERDLGEGGDQCGHCPIPKENYCDLPDVRDMYDPALQPTEEAQWLHPKLTFHTFGGGAEPVTGEDIKVHTSIINGVYKHAKM